MRSVAVVIVTYNSEACIGALLESLVDNTYHSIVVVDNGSTDSTVQVVESQGSVRLVRSRNDGYAAGVNRGIQAEPGADAYLILNPDVVVGRGLVEGLVGALDDDTVGIAVPRVLGPDGHRQDSLRREPSILRAAGMNWTGIGLFSEYVSGDDQYRVSRDADWALGAALLIGRECLDAVGPWDESFFLYSEETDFCLRARDQGWRTRYVPEAVVTHLGGGSGRNDVTHTMQVVNRVRLYARRHSSFAAYTYFALNVASELSWIVRGRHESKASVLGLIRPSRRPPELGCSRSLLPR